MAPSPEYDKEPKAPDKSATDISNEDSKLLQNLTNDQIINSDHKTTNSSVNSEVENNKHVETLDDEKLRALLDEAITYKCPKDREGKSSLFKELLEEVEQDEQACEAAARGAGAGGARRRGAGGGRTRRALQHSNSLQDLVAALAAEPAAAARKHHRHHHASVSGAHQPAVSARAIHGGSLPSGVDTSSLLSEEGCRGVGGGGGYLATVRCVNPPPLAERRVSASDANAPTELDTLNRRSKPMFPMTYTARATLEIGSGAVCMGRAVTTTTASNQVRTSSPTALPACTQRPRGPDRAAAFTSAVERWYDTLQPAHSLANTHNHPAPYHRRDDDRTTLQTTKDKRRQYKNRVGDIQVPLRVDLNPRNVRSMSIGEPGSSVYNVDSRKCERNSVSVGDAVSCEPDIRSKSPDVKTVSKRDDKNNDVYIDMEDETPIVMEGRMRTSIESNYGETEMSDSKTGDIIELEDIVGDHPKRHDATSFSDFVAEQEKLLNVLESTGTNVVTDEYPITELENNNNDIEMHDMKGKGIDREAGDEAVDASDGAVESGEAVSNEVVVQLNRNQDDKASGDRYILAELPNNAYIFLTLPKRLLTTLNTDDKPSVEVTEIENDNNVKPLPDKSKGKKEKAPVGNSVSVKKKDAINKNALRVLLFENLLKSDRGEMSNSGEPSSAIAAKEVDAGIPFSCITTPEVVTSCNTTPSTAQSAVALDPKPQPCSEYRAAASLTGGPPLHAAHPATAHEQREIQPRSVIASSFNGLPLSRPNYGSTATTANDEYKKSIDENGNSVQGYTSPLSGSSQHKKPRRKKSSKNETVIDCRQLDGYQGDKDVNELLRFIESSEQERPKLRAKHKDDADDKTAKKRSAERRKDKEKVKRASSLEELSRTKLEDLTASRPALSAAKPERRSWGDAAPPPPAASPTPPPPPPEPPAPLEQADFQTVTKKRKPRRRTDEPAPRRRPPSPRARQDSAPPSDRSNDSNDDMDSVHSLPDPRPAPPALSASLGQPVSAPPPHASYADIARTRHNIPDLIESCNFYAEGEVGPPPAPPIDADPYPALDARATDTAVAMRRPRDTKPPAAVTRRDRKERPPTTTTAGVAQAVECPAPDVVGVGASRPAVILVDGAARLGARDMDGVTFGFDVNEQLLGDGCDLVREAAGCAAGALAVGGLGATLRYLPPPDSPQDHHLHQLVDYVGSAWEEVLRCGGDSGKVRYYAE